MTTLPDWLTKRADLSPTAVAISTQEEELTWRDLRMATLYLRAQLEGWGIQPGERVAVLMSNDLTFVFTFHALIQQQAVLVPLNTRLTPTELAWQIQDVGATALLTDWETAELVKSVLALSPTVTRHTVDATDYIALITHFTPINLSLSLDTLHSIFYTSGTTGTPKGVMLTYGNHWWSAMGSALNLGIHDTDKWLLVLPLFHVGGMSILFKSVIYGMPIVLHERFDADAVNHALDHEGVTIVSLVATTLQRLLDARQDKPFPSTLRTVLLGGGPCPQPLLERCARLGIPVVQTYGMTETASQSVTLAPQDALRKLGSAGKPLFPVELRIENDGNTAQPDEIGEIVLKGPNITSGYAGRPDATAKTIRDGWLYTGDMGYVDEEGYLYVVDRRTDLIVTGGENVYPAEVEAVLMAHPAVAEAAVVGLPSDEWGQIVAAAVVLRGTTQVTDAELRTFATERLAKYKVPRLFRFVSELPRNAGGKVLRKDVKAGWDSL